MVTGSKIEFECDENELPLLSRKQPPLESHEQRVIDVEIQKLLDKEVISRCQHQENEVISSVFTRIKKDGTYRMILNLKSLNTEVSYNHFKMETLAVALQLVTKDCYMTSIDLKDAYYSIPIHVDHRVMLRFEWKTELYEFNAFPNGLAMAPRKFTKILKPAFATLRKKGHSSTSFLDDSLLFGRTKDECILNTLDTMKMFTALGFVIHPSKSVLTPSKQIQYLGVIIDSRDMTVRLTDERKQKLTKSCKEAIKKEKSKIREVACVIGMIVASFPAVKYGPLFYRALEEDKKHALKMNKGNFDESMILSKDSKSELQWWLDNVPVAYNDIHETEPDLVMNTDSSLKGWGCSLDDKSTGGPWNEVEKKSHINVLEIKAAFLALQCFKTSFQGKHVRLMVDNTTAVACINKMGTNHSIECNRITYQLWEWCIENNIWISAAYIPTYENVIADAESRKVNMDMEYMLCDSEFQRITAELKFQPSIDLFASRLNAKTEDYVSFRPDPGASAIDAFSLNWKHLRFYAFPPFCLLTKVVQKVIRDEAEGIIIAPVWPTQPWYANLEKVTILPVRFVNRLIPEHRLKRNLKLAAFRVSGRNFYKMA